MLSKQLHIIFILFFIGCNNSDISTYRIPKKESQSLLNKISNTSSNTSILWEKPKHWIESKGSNMRLASYNIPSANYMGDLSVTILSGDGGGIKENVNRWRGQLGLDPQNEELILNSSEKRKAYLGNYQVFRIFNDLNQDMALICAIIPLHGSTIFIKLNIAKIALTSIEDEFLIFCDSFKLEKND